MDESIRTQRRSRPRPYDLRRKVLMKNFMREQMTCIPLSGEMLQTADVLNHMSDSSLSIDVNQNRQCANDENDSHLVSSSIDESRPSSSSVLTIESNVTENSDIANNKPHVSSGENDSKLRISKFSRLSSLIRFKKSRKKKNKGVSKAKDVCKSFKSGNRSERLKSEIERYFSWSDSNPTKKDVTEAKSVFSIFKSRKERKAEKSLHKRLESGKSNSISICTKLDQSVQTDLSLSLNEISNVEKSNEILREENRLLSESLSYFMCDGAASFSFRNKKWDTTCNLSSGELKDNSVFSNTKDSLCTDRTTLSAKPRILRSHSVQTRSEKKTVVKCTRTRSLSSRISKRNSNFTVVPSDKLSSNDAYSGSPLPSDFLEHRIPRVRKTSILRSLPINNCSRPLQRRSSMPERSITSIENKSGLLRRRSTNIHNHVKNRHTFHFRDLPVQAFC